MPDPFTETLANRIHELEARNRKLADRVRTLETTKKRQKNLIRGLYYQLHLHRQRVRAARSSRDMWKHRATVKENS